jgi:hypothetical protein
VRKNSSAVLGIEFDTASIILDVSAILEPDPFVSGAAIVLGAIGTKLDISACDAGSQLGCVGKDVGEVGIGAGVAGVAIDFIGFGAPVIVTNGLKIAGVSIGGANLVIDVINIVKTATKAIVKKVTPKK